VRSFYRWEGAIRVDDELLLKIKTRTARRDALVAWLNENHPYDVPEILAVPVEGGSAAYRQFVEDETLEGAD
jgi:periplasmic divalent cation tolerance protein